MKNQLIQQTYTEIKAALDTLYQQRQSTLFFQKITWSITSLYIVLMLLMAVVPYFVSLENSDSIISDWLLPVSKNPMTTVYLFGGLIVLIYLSTTIFVSRFQQFKQQEYTTIAKMIKRLFPKAEFTQNTKAPEKVILKSKLFPWLKKESPIFSFGQIRSQTNGNTVNIADIGISENNISNKITNTLLQIPVFNTLIILYQYGYKNIFTNQSADNQQFTFRGMFCWLSFKKRLNGHTVVLPRSTSTKLDRLASFNFTNEQEVLLEDPRFTNQFVVYSTDQVEARYVLSAALMEKVVALKSKFNQPIYLSFQNRELFVAVKNENGLFAYPAGKLERIEVIEEMVADVEMGLEIGESLK